MTDSLTERRATYLKAWAESLGVTDNAMKENPLVVASILYNRRKNVETCMALAFNLSWQEPQHYKFLERAVKFFKEYMAQFPGCETSPDFLYQFTSAYVAEHDTSYTSLP